MPSLTESLMGMGAFTLDVDRILQGEMTKYNHVLFYWGEKLLMPGVILTHSQGKRKSLRVSGRLIPWWLGFENRGPLIREREYVSGKELLPNPAFVEKFFRYWEVESGWREESIVLPNLNGVWTGNDPPDDLGVQPAVLRSAGSHRAMPGAIHESRIVVHRDAGADQGFIRLRHVYDGWIRHPNLAIPFPEWTVSEDPLYGQNDMVLDNDPQKMVGGAVLRVRTDNPNLAINPSAEQGLTGWTPEFGAWDTTAGPDGMIFRTLGGGPAGKTLIGPTYEAATGEEWTAGGWISMTADADGRGIITVKVTASDGSKTPYFVEIGRREGGFGDAGWYDHQKTFDISTEDGYDRISLQMHVHNSSTGANHFDNLRLYRTRGNRSLIKSPVISLIPGRKYKWIIPARWDAPTPESAIMRPQIRHFDHLGQHDVVVAGPSLGAGNTEIHRVPWEFECPAAMDQAEFQFFSEDVILPEGKYSWIGKGWLQDAEPTSHVAETRGPNVAGEDEVTLTSTAPAGSTQMHLEVVADPPSNLWWLREGHLHRVTTDPVIGEDIARDCLNHPDTGQPLLLPGTINAPEVIQGDYLVENQMNMDLLMDLCKGGLYLPQLSWRANPDWTVDVDTPENLFVDRTDFVLMEGDYVLLPPVEQETSVEDRPTKVLVLGAEIGALRPGAMPFIVQADADNPLEEPAVDRFGNPVDRTLVVSDQAVETTEVAQTFADFEVERNQERRTVTAKLSDYRLAGECDPGDHIYIYDPGAGLTDEAFQQPRRGKDTAPARLLVQSRTLNMGRGPFRIEILRQDGTTFQVPNRQVKWEPATTASFELGDLPPEYQPNEQLGPHQFLRWLKRR